MMKIDKEINLEHFHDGSLSLMDMFDMFAGYKVMLRNVKTAELRPVYYNTYRNCMGRCQDFRYVVGSNARARPRTPPDEVHGIYVLANLKDAQKWGRDMRTCWEDDIWRPVVVEVYMEVGSIIRTGMGINLPMVMVKKVFVKRIVEHLRRP